MKSLCRMKRYCIVVIFLLLALGCSGKVQPTPEDRSAALGVVSETKENRDSNEKQAKTPANVNSETESAVRSPAEDKNQAVVNQPPEAALTEAAAAEKKSSPPAAAEEKESKEAGTAQSRENADASVKENKTGQSGGDQKPAADKEKIVLNFDNADLVEVIKTIADLLDINYLLDTGASGSVTIHTSGELDRSDLFPVFYQILEVNGLTAVKKGSLYRIVPIKDAARMPIGANLGTGDQTGIIIIK